MASSLYPQNPAELLVKARRIPNLDTKVRASLPHQGVNTRLEHIELKREMIYKAFRDFGTVERQIITRIQCLKYQPSGPSRMSLAFGAQAQLALSLSEMPGGLLVTKLCIFIIKSSY